MISTNTKKAISLYNTGLLLSAMVSENLSTCSFWFATKYNRDDIRRYLTESQRKTLSQTIYKTAQKGHSFGAYKATCRSLFRFVNNHLA